MGGFAQLTPPIPPNNIDQQNPQNSHNVQHYRRRPHYLRASPVTLNAVALFYATVGSSLAPARKLSRLRKFDRTFTYKKKPRQTAELSKNNAALGCFHDFSKIRPIFNLKRSNIANRMLKPVYTRKQINSFINRS